MSLLKADIVRDAIKHSELNVFRMIKKYDLLPVTRKVRTENEEPVLKGR